MAKSQAKITNKGSALQTATIMLADTSTLTVDQVVALKRATTIFNWGHAGQTLFPGFRVAQLSDAESEIDRLKARIVALEGTPGDASENGEAHPARRRRAPATAGA